jgi:hypothetical protein
MKNIAALVSLVFLSVSTIAQIPTERTLENPLPDRYPAEG